MMMGNERILIMRVFVVTTALISVLLFLSCKCVPSSNKTLPHKSLVRELEVVGECEWKMRTVSFLLKNYAMTHNGNLPTSDSMQPECDQTSWFTKLGPRLQLYYLLCTNDPEDRVSSFAFNTCLYGKNLSDLKKTKNEVLLYEKGNFHGLKNPLQITVGSLFESTPEPCL